MSHRGKPSDELDAHDMKETSPAELETGGGEEWSLMKGTSDRMTWLAFQMPWNEGG